ncbi:MAG: type II toxin-antitoxin system VapC family toxin [Armatimonadota bacterium]
MKFWDSSALLSLIAAQAGNEEIKVIFEDDPCIVIWWGTRIELASGLCRLHREGLIDDAGLSSLLKIVQQLADDADEVEPTEHVRLASMRILKVHNLRAADSLQLAAALAWMDHDPGCAGFVCLDKRLREAAEKEGFVVMPG